MRFWVQCKKRSVVSSFGYATTPNYFNTKNIALEKVKFLIVLPTVVWKFFDFFDNSPAKRGFLGSTDKKNWLNFLCKNGSAQFF